MTSNGPRIPAPFFWYGGKTPFLRQLLSLMPAHDVYIEPFCGSAALFFAKAPARFEVINDIHQPLVEFFRVLRDHPDEFMHLAYFTLHSRELYEECRREWNNETDPVRRAWRWWVVAKQSFSGYWGASWSLAVETTSRHMAGTCARLLSTIRVLPACASRLHGAHIESRPAIEVLQQYCSPHSFCYLDPPYVPDVRRSPDVYMHEMTVEDHAELVRTILGLPGKFALSGYKHEVYAPLEEAGWVRLDFNRTCLAAACTRATGIRGNGARSTMQPRIESLWIDPQTAQEKVGQLSLWDSVSDSEAGYNKEDLAAEVEP